MKVKIIEINQSDGSNVGYIVKVKRHFFGGWSTHCWRGNLKEAEEYAQYVIRQQKRTKNTKYKIVKTYKV